MRGQLRPIVTLLLISSTHAARPQGTGRWTPPSQPIYVVRPNYTVEGSSPSATKFGDLLMVQIHPEDPALTNRPTLIDGARFYEKGKLMALYVDGERRGDVRIEAVRQHHCNWVAALVAPTLSGVSRSAAGLATNEPGVKSRPGVRRNATPAERTSALRLATREFVRNRVATALMTRINLQSLVALEVDGSKAKTLVGSFFIHTKAERHDVFLVARFSRSESSLEYAQYQETEDLEDFKDHRRIALVDHLDLDQDGVNELVLSVGGYESEVFEIYSRDNGEWQRVASSGAAGC